jgi:hypothetical protein
MGNQHHPRRKDNRMSAPTDKAELLSWCKEHPDWAVDEIETLQAHRRWLRGAITLILRAPASPVEEHEIFQMIHAREEAIRMMGATKRDAGYWQPIETAPKKTRVLVGNGFEEEVVTAELDEHGTWFVSPLVMTYDERGGLAEVGFRPTHWAPCPEPPMDGAESAGA